MRRKRKSGTAWQRAGVLSPALLLAFGCTAYPTLKNIPTDCSIEAGYDFDPTMIDGTMTYPSGDPTLGSVITAMVEPIPEGSLCGAASAFVIRASHFNDWGDLAGFYGFGNPYRDESAYQGMSFWARAPGASGKSFTVALDDANTFATTPDAGTNCTNYNVDGGNTGPVNTIYDPGTGLPISGTTTSAPPANACGNSYSVAVTVTGGWQFYTIPFPAFLQAAMPSRVPNAQLKEIGTVPGTGLLTNKLMGLVFRMPKATTMELWLAKMDFYRKKTAGAAGDGGADAPRM